jgi:hypothetical protein
VKPEWARRLGPLVLVGLVALGAFFWRGGLGLLPVERTLVWKVRGEFGSIRRVELQLYDGEKLLKREELQTPSGLTLEPTQKLLLGRGTYTARVLVWREKAAEPEASAVELEVGDAEVVTIEPLRD